MNAPDAVSVAPRMAKGTLTPTSWPRVSDTCSDATEGATLSTVTVAVPYPVPSGVGSVACCARAPTETVRGPSRVAALNGTDVPPVS